MTVKFIKIYEFIFINEFIGGEKYAEQRHDRTRRKRGENRPAERKMQRRGALRRYGFRQGQKPWQETWEELMPRPRRLRKVCSQPDVTYFKPAGVRMKSLQEIVLTVEEYEAIRLKDYLGLEQSEAARKMDISQPTLHRLLLEARKKIGEAISEGKALRIEGGHYQIKGQE